jgi:hypothetical protein
MLSTHVLVLKTQMQGLCHPAKLLSKLLSGLYRVCCAVGIELLL